MKHYKYSIFIFLLIISLIMTCGNGRIGEEGEVYIIQIQDIKYKIQIKNSAIFGPFTHPNSNLLSYFIVIYWETENVSKKQVTFFWDQFYLIDDRGTTYNPKDGKYGVGTGILYPEQKCNGASIFAPLPEFININNVKCGIISDKNKILIKLQPELAID